MKSINTAVIFKITEGEAEKTLTHDIYNETGDVIGQIPEEEYKAKRRELKGKRVLYVEAICNGKTARYQSPVVENKDVNIANALATVLVACSGPIVKQFRSELDERRIISLN